MSLQRCESFQGLRVSEFTLHDYIHVTIRETISLGALHDNITCPVRVLMEMHACLFCVASSRPRPGLANLLDWVALEVSSSFQGNYTMLCISYWGNLILDLRSSHPVDTSCAQLICRPRLVGIEHSSNPMTLVPTEFAWPTGGWQNLGCKKALVWACHAFAVANLAQTIRIEELKKGALQHATSLTSCSVYCCRHCFPKLQEKSSAERRTRL